MSKQGTILIVDDNKGVLTAVQLLLKNYFTKVITLHPSLYRLYCAKKLPK